jgi:hypothetical protein
MDDLHLRSQETLKASVARGKRHQFFHLRREETVATESEPSSSDQHNVRNLG